MLVAVRQFGGGNRYISSVDQRLPESLALCPFATECELIRCYSVQAQKERMRRLRDAEEMCFGHRHFLFGQ